MLLIFLPLTGVACTIQMAVDAVTMCLIVLPMAIIDITISMDQSTLSVSFVFHPVALVHGAIRPNLDTLALPCLSADQPFTLVSCTVFENHCGALFAFAEFALKCRVIVYEVAKLGTHFLIDIKELLRLTCTFTFS